MDPVSNTWQRRLRRWMRRGENCVLGRQKDRRLLPDFLVIGAQKAGTTWLHQNLLCHEEIFVPQKKELHYFNSDLKLSLFGYSDYFSGAQGKVIGEVTPAYSILPDGDIELVKRILPDVKLVFLMRNPVERAWSQGVMELVARGNRQIEEISFEEWATFLRSPTSFDRGHYSAILARWEKHFHRSSFFTAFFDDIQERPEDVLNGLFAHLGVGAVKEWGAFPVRKVVAPAVASTGLDGKGKGQAFAVEETTPELKVSTSKLMPDAVRILLTDLYKDSVAELRCRFRDKMPRWS